MKAAASILLGVAKLADRTMHTGPCTDSPLLLPQHLDPMTTTGPGPSTVCQSDEGCLGLHRDERNSTAEQEQLSKQLDERPYPRHSTMGTLSPGEGKKSSCRGQGRRGGTHRLKG